jgi:hypothetical protein
VLLFPKQHGSEKQGFYHMSRREEYNRFSGGDNLPNKDTMTPEQASKWFAEDARMKKRQEEQRKKVIKNVK